MAYYRARSYCLRCYPPSSPRSYPLPPGLLGVVGLGLLVGVGAPAVWLGLDPGLRRKLEKQVADKRRAS